MVAVSERDEWERRRNETLTYYPEVARVGNLADALTEALAEMGSSLTASPPFPLDEPVFSPFNDHPDARGMTVPEFASVSAEGRKCDVSIALFEFPLGMYGITFFVDGAIDRVENTVTTGDLGTIVASDLATVALVVRSSLEDGAELAQLAQASGAAFEPPPRFGSTPTLQASTNGIIANIRAKLDSNDPGDEERARRAGEAMKEALRRDNED